MTFLLCLLSFLAGGLASAWAMNLALLLARQNKAEG